ncbi:MAG TPA: hypothetical protein VMF06_01815, partial [Candidatus Limnocylindria bacterium]|nr:hypothetical protein [Candidatus Limnocylindria bacterium]
MKSRLFALLAFVLTLACAICHAEGQTDPRINHPEIFREPLYWVGDTPPTDEDTAALIKAFEGIPSTCFDRLETFVVTHPDSAWTPSVDANLAVVYRGESRYTRALEHWEEAWAATKDDESGGGRAVRGYVLGNWPGLLASLGRKDRLEALFKENKGRSIDNLQHQVGFNLAKEAFHTMRQHPQLSYRCGPIALWNVAKALGIKDARTSSRMRPLRQGLPQTINELAHWRSPTNGFSADSLMDAAEALGLGLVAIQRTVGSEIIAPSLVHWKQDHYAAILEHAGDRCLVSDPTFSEKPHWVSDATIEEESSGFFLVPEKRIAPSHRRVTRADASQVRGQGIWLGMRDSSDFFGMQCQNCGGMPVWSVSEPFASLWLADQPVGWKTSEGEAMGFLLSYSQRAPRPYPTYNTSGSIVVSGWNNNWLSWIEITNTRSYPAYVGTFNGMTVLANDPCASGCTATGVCVTGPLSTGTDVAVAGYYYVPSSYTTNSNLTGYKIADAYNSSCPGPGYTMPIKATTTPIIVGDPPELFQDIKATVAFAEGGQVDFDSFTAFSTNGLQSSIDPKQHVRLVVTNSAAFPNRISGAVVYFPDGSQDQYTNVYRSGPIIISSPASTTFTAKLYRSAHVDPTGRTTHFYYELIAVAAQSFARMNIVTDPDGNSATLSYSTNYPNLITKVTDPFGRYAEMGYDATTHRLNSITDAAGLQSTIAYGASGYISSLTTPYGTTTFTIPADVAMHPDGSPSGVGVPNRSVLVEEPGGAKDLTIYEIKEILDPLLPTITPSPTGFDSSLQPQFPAGITGTTFEYGDPSGYASTNIVVGLVWRNSFHWGRKQTPRLSTTVAADLTATDRTFARMRHWLVDDSQIQTVGTLSFEIDTSPDGAQLGGITFYDYPGKVSSNLQQEGTSSLPSMIARRIPGGPTSWVRYQRNSLGQPTSIESSYTMLDGTVGIRTNTISYLNDIYPVVITKTDGSLDTGYKYNANNQVEAITNAVGEVTAAAYDSTTHKLTDVTLPNGQGLSFNWSGGVLASVSATSFFTYNFTWSAGQVATTTSPLGLTQTYTYDNLDRLIKVAYPDGTYETNMYSKLDLVGSIDRLGNTNLFGYNSLRQLTSRTNALGAITYFNRCVCGLLDSVVNPLGQTTSFLYDNAGHLLQQVPPDSDPVRFTYDVYGRLLTASDGVTTYTLGYNNQGGVTNVSNSLGSLWTGIFDAEDRLVRSTNSNGIGSTNTFDALNRVLTTTWPDGGVETLGYTAGYGKPTSYTSQIGKVQNMGYDKLQRLVTQAVPGVFTNSFAYNGLSQITSLLDGNGHQTTWTYDTYGRAIQKNDNSGGIVWTNGYNANGWMTKHYTPAKGLATLSYNAVGNLTNAVYPVSSTLNFAYDALNRLQTMTDGVGTSSFTYTAFGALASEDGPWASDTISYSYTANRRRSGLNLQQPSGVWQQSYQYDAGNRLTNTASPAGAFVYQYLTSSGNAPSLVSKVTMPSGGYIQQGFDSVGRMQSTAMKNSGGTTLDSRSYL